jgi:hypothetical protein
MPIHSSSRAPTSFRKGHLEQREREHDEHDAQHHRTGGTPQDAQPALRGRQFAAGQGDHDGVVAAEQDVDHDDLTDSEPELGRTQIHLLARCICRSADSTGARHMKRTNEKATALAVALSVLRRRISATESEHALEQLGHL